MVGTQNSRGLNCFVNLLQNPKTNISSNVYVFRILLTPYAKKILALFITTSRSHLVLLFSSSFVFPIVFLFLFLFPSPLLPHVLYRTNDPARLVSTPPRPPSPSFPFPTSLRNVGGKLVCSMIRAFCRAI